MGTDRQTDRQGSWSLAFSPKRLSDSGLSFWNVQLLPFPCLNPATHPAPPPRTAAILTSCYTQQGQILLAALVPSRDEGLIPSQCPARAWRILGVQQMGLGSLAAMIDALWSPLLGEERSRQVLHHSYCQPRLGECLQGEVGKPQWDGPELRSKPRVAVYHSAFKGKSL